MEEDIEYYKKLIEMMRSDGKIFGLVREDYEKINEWTKKIVQMKNDRR